MNQNTHGVPALNRMVLEVKTKLEGRMDEERRLLELARDAFARRDIFTGEVEAYESGMHKDCDNEDRSYWPIWQFRVEWLFGGHLYKFRVVMGIRDGKCVQYKCADNIDRHGNIVTDPWWRLTGYVDLGSIVPGWFIIERLLGWWTDSVFAGEVVDVFIRGARRMVEGIESKRLDVKEVVEEHGFCGDRPDLGNR